MRIMLIGGRSQEPDNFIIEEKMLSYYDNPRVLLFPTATKDSNKSINNLKILFDKLKCSYDFALLYSESRDEIINKINNADILYFNGGNTDVLVNKIIEIGLDDIIKSTDKMLVGISAGMIMMSNMGMGDSYSYQDNNHVYNYKMVKGLGILNIVCCPHYENDDLVVFNDEAIKYDCDAYALEGDTAIIFDNGEIEVIKSNKKRSAYKFTKELNYKMESLYENINIATMGPEGTYCDVATKKYINNDNKYKVSYYSSIRKTIDGIKDNDLAVLPFENSLDGYVYETIDNLLKYDYSIIDCAFEHIDFAFVSNAGDISKVKNVYAQFKAKGECLDFLTNKHEFNIITTDSNMASLNLLLKSDESYGAIIPMHKLGDVNFNLVIKNVSDSENNYTKFVVVSKDKKKIEYSGRVICSLIVEMIEDRPGVLFNALKTFNEYNINMNAILSRPTKEGLGKYYFYIEVSSDASRLSDIEKAIGEIGKDKNYKVKNLGIYPVR